MDWTTCNCYNITVSSIVYLLHFVFTLFVQGMSFYPSKATPVDLLYDNKPKLVIQVQGLLIRAMDSVTRYNVSKCETELETNGIFFNCKYLIFS